MGWVEDLRGEVVGLDTAPLIYFIEGNPAYADIVAPFFEAMHAGEIFAVTSMVTLIEVLVHPMRHDDAALAEEYRDILLSAKGLRIVPLSREIAEETARLRASRGLRIPDAIQLSTAANENASYFLTNDSRLPSLPGLRMLVLDRLLEQPDEDAHD